VYKITLQRNQYVTVKVNGKEIKCLSGLFVTTADLAELDRLVRLANIGAAEQSVQADDCLSCAGSGKKRNWRNVANVSRL
jgi:hypothetical protein